MSLATQILKPFGFPPNQLVRRRHLCGRRMVWENSAIGKSRPGAPRGQSSSNNAGFQLTISGDVGRAYRLQASSNVMIGNWFDLLSYTNTQGTTNSWIQIRPIIPSAFVAWCRLIQSSGLSRHYFKPAFTFARVAPAHRTL